ncbi:MAG: hypothetical protein ABJH05_03195 [Fulvivirga sp.]
MKTTALLLLNIFYGICLFGQTQNAEQKQEFLNRINSGLGLSDILYNGSGVQSDIEGDPYLLEYQLPGSIMILNGNAPIEVIKMKYHVLNNYIQCDYKGRTLAIDGSKVLSFNLAHRYFINTNELGAVNNELSGFYEVISDGSPSLLAHDAVKIKKPDYNIALDVGNKNYRLIKNRNYYLLIENKIYGITKKKDLWKMIESNQKEIKEFIKAERISFSDENDLVRLCTYLNNLK